MTGPARSEQPSGDHGQRPHSLRPDLLFGHCLSPRLAISADGHTAYSVLDVDDSLTKIDLTTNPPTQVAEIQVGNVPNSLVISSDGSTACVSNEAGRVATADDFQEYSDGTNVVSTYPTGAIATATISVVNLGSFSVTHTIAYVALYNANAVAVVDLSAGAPKPVKGTIPVGYAPSSVVLDSADSMLLVANDKGIGTTNTDL